MVLVALKTLNVLSISRQTTLKAYFINITCALCLWGGGESRSGLWARSVAHCMQLLREREMCVMQQVHIQGQLWTETEAEEAQAINTCHESKTMMMKASTAYLLYFSVYFLSVSSCQLWKRQEECKPAEIQGSSWKSCHSRHIFPCGKLLQKLCLAGCNSS